MAPRRLPTAIASRPAFDLNFSFAASPSKGASRPSRRAFSASQFACARPKTVTKLDIAERRPCWVPAGRALSRTPMSAKPAKPVQVSVTARPTTLSEPSTPETPVSTGSRVLKSCLKKAPSTPPKKAPSTPRKKTRSTPRKATPKAAAPIWRAPGPCTSFKKATRLQNLRAPQRISKEIKDVAGSSRARTLTWGANHVREFHKQAAPRAWVKQGVEGEPLLLNPAAEEEKLWPELVEEKEMLQHLADEEDSDDEDCLLLPLAEEEDLLLNEEEDELFLLPSNVESKAPASDAGIAWDDSFEDMSALVQSCIGH